IQLTRPGDKVLLKNSKTSGKLDPKFETKPYIVQTKEGQELTVKSDEVVVYRRDISFVKPYQEPGVQETVTESERSEDTAVSPTKDGNPVAVPISRPSRVRKLPDKFKDFVLNTPSKRISFSDGVLLRNNRIVIPRSLQQRVLELAHQGHQGIAKTKARLRTKYQAQKITPRYPRANGEAERLNRSINKVVQTAIAESRDWRKTIDAWLLACRTTPHMVTGQPPAAMMFERNVNDKLPSLPPSAPIKIHRMSYRQHDANNKQKRKCYHDIKKKVQPSSIKVGDQVLIRSEKKGKVALPWRANTFRVTAVKGDSILIEDGNHRLMRHSTAVKKVPITVTTAPDVPTTPPEAIVAQRPRRSIKRQPDLIGYSSTA
ncbi:hypothetical protein BOX15_Mlig023251g7, partial, partial [Paramuricea clavata]